MEISTVQMQMMSVIAHELVLRLNLNANQLTCVFLKFGSAMVTQTVSTKVTR